MSSSRGTKRSSNLSNDGPPSKKRKNNEQEDPLEAFMKSITKTASKQKKKALNKEKKIQSKAPNDLNHADMNNKNRNQRIDFEQETPMDAFIDQMQKKDTLFLPSRKGTDGYNSDEEVYNVAKYVNKLERDDKVTRNKLLKSKESELKYDDYGNIITANKDRIIEDLLPIDHSKVYYKKFKKNFYSQHADLNKLSHDEIHQLRDKYNVKLKLHGINDIYSLSVPVESFPYFGFDEKLMDIIIDQQFKTPTPIQMQAIPLLMSGYDMIGLAKTGSGKTAAFIWPMINHILEQIKDDPIEENCDGPIGLILSPTHELATQIYKECLRYLSIFGIRVAPLYGGMQMHSQRLKLNSGVELVVANPGRLIDLIKDKSTNCRRITYVVVDEVDKMFSLGFESQLFSILGQIRNDRQICMFSATMNEKIEKVASNTFNNYLRVSIGDEHSSNPDVQQYVEVLSTNDDKFEWLSTRINLFIKNGLILIFCSSKQKCEILQKKLNNNNILTAVIHGDKLQKDRLDIINKFKLKKFNILVATDVVSRGINIIDIKTVINYDCPFNMDSYIHRVGRTGRAGTKDGFGYTLLVPNQKNDESMAEKLLHLLQKLRMYISPKLKQMIDGELIEYKNSKKNNKNKNKHKKKTKDQAAKHSYHKGGFNPHDAGSVKKSFLNTFVKSTDQDNTNQTDTHFFNDSDDKSLVANIAYKKKKSRWGDK